MAKRAVRSFRSSLLVRGILAATASVSMVGVSTVGAAPSTVEKRFSGSVYDLAKPELKLFSFAGEAKQDGGDIRFRFEYRDREEKTALIEEAVIGTDGSVRSYLFDQQQIGKQGIAKVEKGRVVFRYGEPGALKETDSEKRPDNLVFGPTLIYYLQKHWAEISRGQEVQVRYGVIDRQETIGFKLFKDAEKKFQGKPAVVIEMVPSSPIIRALVSPSYLTLSKDGSVPYAIEGLTPLRVEKGGKWKMIEAKVVVENFQQ